MIFKKLSFLLCSFLVIHFVAAQSALSIKTSVEKDKILLGEPFHLLVEVTMPEQSKTGFAMPDSIAHFEFLENPVIDSNISNGLITLTGRYKMTSFDSGHWVIPSYYLTEKIKSDPISVDVVFTDFDPQQPYHDIKDIEEVKSPKKKTTWWWYAIAGTLALALVLLYLLRKKKQQPVTPVLTVTINPFEEAMKELKQLEENKPDEKLYYSKLVGIFRLYVYNKKGILSLQKTTDDLIIQLSKSGLQKEQFDKLSQVLRLSDFVKFAKYIPTQENNTNSIVEIRNAITAIEKTGV
jgi:LPXTG-motif cell wall-anchored protein